MSEYRNPFRPGSEKFFELDSKQAFVNQADLEPTEEQFDAAGDYPSPAPEQIQHDQELLAALQSALADPNLLDSVEKEVIRLKYFENLPVGKIATKINLDAKLKVNVNLKSALRKLRGSRYFKNSALKI